MIMNIRYASLTTRVGDMLAVATDQGLCALRFCEEGTLPVELRAVRKQYPGAQFVEDPAGLKPILKQVENALAGKLSATEISLDPVGTKFQKRVWRELAKVPWGKTLSYSDLARKAGNPRAVRAVASACASNPITFVVPCHRVLRKDGSLGGYFWGLSKKQSLLQREQA
jgi:AraC family transcriptional regulator, regulatory protein of adaptative response / methylated-DNA-[protein]-cysteine methyltransferase